MNTFHVRALDGKGKRREFFRESSDEASLSRALSREGLFPLRIEPDTGKRSGRAAGGRIGRKVVEEFSASLSLLLDSGLSFRDALAVLSRTARGKVKPLSTAFMEKISRGVSFSEALSATGSAFPPVYRGLVRVGEKTGTLEAVMKELSVYLEEDSKIREKISNALMYPALVLSVAFLGVIFLSLFILPRMVEMFAALGGNSAVKMGGMISTLKLTTAAALSLVALGGAAALTVRGLRGRAPALERAVSRVIVKLPVIGGFILRRELLSFSFAMETLAAAAVPMEDALREAAFVMKNAALSEEIRRVREAVVRGERLSHAVSASAILPETLRTWIAIGEETGCADRVFRQLKVYYKRETEAFSAASWYWQNLR